MSWIYAGRLKGNYDDKNHFIIKKHYFIDKKSVIKRSYLLQTSQINEGYFDVKCVVINRFIVQK